MGLQCTRIHSRYMYMLHVVSVNTVSFAFLVKCKPLSCKRPSTPVSDSLPTSRRASLVLMVREAHPAAAVRLAFLGVCTRGAGTSLYDYADYAERLLQVRVSHVFCCCSSSPDALFRRHVLALRDRFGAHVVHEISRWPPNVTTDVDPLLSASHVTDLCAFCHVVHRLHIYIHAVQRRHVRGAFNSMNLASRSNPAPSSSQTSKRPAFPAMACYRT